MNLSVRAGGYPARVSDLPAPRAALADLDDEQLDALLAAAAWYAKYHERSISELAGDRSALATARRERFLSLHEALEKLGVRLRRPEGIERAPTGAR